MSSEGLRGGERDVVKPNHCWFNVSYTSFPLSFLISLSLSFFLSLSPLSLSLFVPFFLFFPPLSLSLSLSLSSFHSPLFFIYISLSLISYSSFSLSNFVSFPLLSFLSLVHPFFLSTTSNLLLPFFLYLPRDIPYHCLYFSFSCSPPDWKEMAIILQDEGGQEWETCCSVAPRKQTKAANFTPALKLFFHPPPVCLWEHVTGLGFVWLHDFVVISFT